MCCRSGSALQPSLELCRAVGAAPALPPESGLLRIPERDLEISGGGQRILQPELPCAVSVSCSSLCSSSRAGHWDVLAVGRGRLGSSSKDSTKQALASRNLVP